MLNSDNKIAEPSKNVKSRRQVIIHLLIGAVLLGLMLFLTIWLSPDLFNQSPSFANSDNTGVIYTNIYTRQWESTAQCEAWVEDHLIRLWYVGDHLANCNDYAFIMQDTAMQEGLPVSIALTWDTVYYRNTVTHIGGGHAGCMVFINRVYYWFDPNPDFYNGLIRVTEAKQ